MVEQAPDWTAGRVRWELAHTLCCQSGAPCSLRRTQPRATDNLHVQQSASEWAGWMLSAHGRADVAVAMAELWPVTAGLDWEHLSNAAVRALPPEVAALWVLIVRGPTDATRHTVPDGQRQASRFGFLPWRSAQRILRTDQRTIKARITEAVDAIAAWLNPPWVILPAERSTAWMGVHCTPQHHEFSVSGDAPADGARCLCGRRRFAAIK